MKRMNMVTLVVLFAVITVAQDFGDAPKSCPEGKILELGIASTSYVVPAGCYTPKKHARLMEEFNKSICLDTGYSSMEWRGDVMHIEGERHEWINHKCVKTPYTKDIDYKALRDMKEK